MASASFTSPQTLNLYNYCGNDPINHVDPSGLFWGWLKKFFGWIAKAFKWIVVVVTVAVIVLGIMASHGMLSAFFTKLLGVLAELSNFVGAASFQTLAADGMITIASVGIGVETYISAGLATVGAIANSFTNSPPQGGKICPPNIERLIRRGLWFKYTISEVNKMASKDYKDRPDSGVYKEIGGWILQSKDGKSYKAVIKPPEPQLGGEGDTSTQVRGLGEPRKYINDLMKEGWRVIGDFHSHPNKISNPGEVSIANARKVPGVWIYPDATTEVYGPSHGVLGVGIPKGCPK